MASAVCVADVCSLDTGQTYIGDYTWFVRGWSPGGYGDWGSSFSFSAIIPVPAEILKTAPQGIIATSMPTFTWEHDAAAVWYQIWVGSAGEPVFSQWQMASAVCTMDACSLDTGVTYFGDYTWYVRGCSSGGYGDWGSATDFSYGITLNSPSGTVSGTGITYNWNDVGTSTTWYRLWVGQDGVGAMIDQWAQANIACNGTTCSFDDPNARTNGNYSWYIQPYGTYGYGPWSTAQTFAVGAAFEEFIPVVVESDSPLVTRNGNWQTENTVLASGGNYLYSSGNTDDVLMFEFEGRHIEVVYVQLPSSGVFAIEIDNTIYRTVITEGDSIVGSRAIIDYVDAGHHTLRVYPVDGVIAIDAFIVEY